MPSLNAAAENANFECRWHEKESEPSERDTALKSSDIGAPCVSVARIEAAALIRAAHSKCPPHKKFAKFGTLENNNDKEAAKCSAQFARYLCGVYASETELAISPAV